MRQKDFGSSVIFIGIECRNGKHALSIPIVCSDVTHSNFHIESFLVGCECMSSRHFERSNNACAVCEGRITKKRVLLAPEKDSGSVARGIVARARVSGQVSPDLLLVIIHNHHQE